MRGKPLTFNSLPLEVAVCDLKRVGCATHLEITVCDLKASLMFANSELLHVSAISC